MIAGRHAPSSHEALPPVRCRRDTPSLSCSDVPVLRCIEKAIHPRAYPHQATKRVVGVAVLILNIALVFGLIPLAT
jgi:hypothetical protein